MSAPTVRISETSHRVLRELAKKTGRTMLETLDAAVERYRRELFMEAVNEGYARMRADPETWLQEMAERKEWDTTLMDGLEPDERWTEDGRCIDPDTTHRKRKHG